MLKIPDFSKDINAFREELAAIRELLERLVKLEEAKGNARGKLR